MLFIMSRPLQSLKKRFILNCSALNVLACPNTKSTDFFPENGYNSRIWNPKWYSTQIKGFNSNSRTDHSVKGKELLIPVPYGNIAAKVWGRDNGIPILALHGWLDNCGTFDKLIPMLSPQYYIVAVDTPGHGLSSYMPPGCYYNDIGLIMDLKKVTDFLGWKEFNILGHSLGGGLAFMFSSIFPELVKKMVVLDIFKPSSRAINKFPHETRKAINNHFKNEILMSKSPPLYTIETAAERLQKGMFNEVTLEGAKILNKRGTRLSDCGKGVIFSRDLRCRTIEEFSRRSHEYIEQFMSAVQCELLLIMANNTHPNYQSSTPEVMDKFIGIYEKNCKKFVLEKVDGNHFVHLNNPERVAPLINNFIK